MNRTKLLVCRECVTIRLRDVFVAVVIRKDTDMSQEYVERSGLAPRSLMFWVDFRGVVRCYQRARIV